MRKYVPRIVERACEFAVTAHGDQMYGKDPYYYHLRAVVSTLQAFGIWDKQLLAAAYLHDVLEDTGAPKALLVLEFGQCVADIVDACTDGKGKNRKERKERPYKLIPTMPGAVTVKVADRLSNVLSNIVEGNSSLIKMYAKEHEVFYERLYPCVPHDDRATRAMFQTLQQQLILAEA